MKCDQIHLLIIDYLYNEISDEDNRILQSHLANCDNCRQELAALKGTSNILQKWEDVEPDFNLVMVTQKVNWFENVKEKFRKLFPKPKKAGFAFAYGFVGVFLLMAVSNTEISYQQGNFNMKMALFSKGSTSAQNQLTAQQTEALIESGVISDGMLPKTDCALSALRAGVESVQILDGTVPHALLLEIFTDAGIGTQMVTAAGVGDDE